MPLWRLAFPIGFELDRCGNWSRNGCIGLAQSPGTQGPMGWRHSAARGGL